MQWDGKDPWYLLEARYDYDAAIRKATWAESLHKELRCSGKEGCDTLLENVYELMRECEKGMITAEAMAYRDLKSAFEKHEEDRDATDRATALVADRKRRRAEGEEMLPFPKTRSRVTVLEGPHKEGSFILLGSDGDDFILKNLANGDTVVVHKELCVDVEES